MPHPRLEVRHVSALSFPLSVGRTERIGLARKGGLKEVMLANVDWHWLRAISLNAVRFNAGIRRCV